MLSARRIRVLVMCRFGFPLLLATLALLSNGCSRRESRAESGIAEQVLHAGNGTDPQDLDPHLTTGEPEHKILMALFEGLVSEAPDDLRPLPGVAERWDVSPDGLIYTFHLRRNARWSNGDTVTAHDFTGSLERMLQPELAAKYANMLFPLKNAEAFNLGKIKDFSQVGARALDDFTLELTLHSPAPYFLSLIMHNSWFPVHLPTIRRHGSIVDRANRWTLPENFVGNGAFRLKEWKINSHVLVERSTNYWDAANVKLRQIYFYPTENQDAEERAFRAGMLHLTKDVPQTKIEVYRENRPEVFRAEPILSTYFYRLNTTRPPLNDKRVRKALALAIDRDLIVRRVTRGGQVPAFHFTPPGILGYQPRARLSGTLNDARRLLAEAGFPDGKGFRPITILINTHEGHKAVAEAIQQMWKQNLGISVNLRNEEWKVFLTTTEKLDYDVARAGWGGDYPDPNTFLELVVTDGGNNETGWSNAGYDRLIAEAAKTADPVQRFEIFQQAEAIFLDELPFIPLYFYTRPTLIHPAVRNFFPTVLDMHPWKHVYLEAPAR
ncbi:MAG TPA: peptide ABC transporter substrate-binding protein [Verrucomicrobiae bacterium]|nr:peptide ABC transporter substrate-binding protein [Verrucomicrobiae bacterium]